MTCFRLLDLDIKAVAAHNGLVHVHGVLDLHVAAVKIKAAASVIKGEKFYAKGMDSVEISPFVFNTPSILSAYGFYSFEEFREKIEKTGAAFVSCDAFLPALSTREEERLKKVSLKAKYRA